MPPKKTSTRNPKSPSRTKKAPSPSLDEVYTNSYTKTLTTLTRHCTRTLSTRGDLSEIATIAKLKDELRAKLDTKYRNDKFLENVKAAFLIQRGNYDQKPVANFASNTTEPYHLPELRRRFEVEAIPYGLKSKVIALNEEQFVARLAEFIALEDNADLPFLQKKPAPPDQTTTAAAAPAKKQSKMVVANKGLTDVVRIIESLSEARLIEKVNQELFTSIFQKRLEDGSLQEWSANQYSAQKCNAFPSNRDEPAPQTSSELMVNFVNCLLNLMSPEAKRKLNRS